MLAITASADLAPLRVSQREMLRFADEGYFPLSAAAAQMGRKALALAANAQTFSFIALLVFVAASSARRGFTSPHARGWSHGVWIVGLLAFCLAPSILPGMTPQRLDYAMTGSWSGARATPMDAIYGAHGLNRAMLPTVFIVERAIFGALVLIAVAFVMHDLSYRLREALEDFGVFEQEDRVQPAAPRNAGPSSGDRAKASAGGPEAFFGQREEGAPRAAADSPDAAARRVLGVSATASRREIERAYRSQMKRAHPDHGGTVERAAALNAARDALLRR